RGWRTRPPPTRATLRAHLTGRRRARPLGVASRGQRLASVPLETGSHYRLSAVSGSAFEFEVVAREGEARAGTLRLAHGDVETPAFMPVGTRGAVRGVTIDELEALGAEIVLANTYHLHLRPGADLVAGRGGLHAFMAWPRPILTDSGGYQIFSLASRRKLNEAGVIFHSHLDGS